MVVLNIYGENYKDLSIKSQCIHIIHSSISECNRVERWEPKLLNDQCIRDGWPPCCGLKWENICPYWHKLFLKHDLRQEPALKNYAKDAVVAAACKASQRSDSSIFMGPVHYESVITQFQLPPPSTFQTIKICSSIFYHQLPSDLIFFMIKLIYKNETQLIYLVYVPSWS